jgi:hypothetical protein
MLEGARSTWRTTDRRSFQDVCQRGFLGRHTHSSDAKSSSPFYLPSFGKPRSTGGPKSNRRPLNGGVGLLSGELLLTQRPLIMRHYRQNLLLSKQDPPFIDP